MSEKRLPPMPEPATVVTESDVGYRCYTAFQMREYARAALESRRDDEVDRLLNAVFKLCESTEEATVEEPKNEHQCGFERGRRFEAKSIRRAIGAWFQDEFCGRSFMGEPAEFGPMLDDDGKAMMSTSHHYTVKDIKALIDDLKAVEQGAEQPEWVNRDHRTRCGVIWRVMAALVSDVPVAPLTEAERQDSARLDAMQLHRISVVPEYEGPWDAKVYGDEGEPEAVGAGNTPREAIDNALSARATGEQQ